MAIILVTNPQPKLYSRYMLHGYGRVDNDAQFREQLRMMVAILLAQWTDTDPNLNGVIGHIFDVVTSEHFYTKGFAKTTQGGVRPGDYAISKKFAEMEAKYPTFTNGPRFTDERLWFCSYVGFERVSSKWAKENHPGCHGYICMRIYNQDERHNQLDAHTIQIYF